MFYIRLDIVNKKEYEELNKDYKEIKISFPKDSEELEKDFEYLGLDYKNLSLQDTHIKECAIICEEDPDFSVNVTGRLNRLIAKASNQGYTTPFNDMKELYNLVYNIQHDDREKLLAILEAEEEKIINIKDVLKYVKNLDSFYLDWASLSNEEYAKNEIHLGELYMEDVLPYIDLETLGKDLIRNRKAILTDYGVLCRMDEGITNENEEEFGGE
jgi:hypothetical protein